MSSLMGGLKEAIKNTCYERVILDYNKAFTHKPWLTTSKNAQFKNKEIQRIVLHQLSSLGFVYKVVIITTCNHLGFVAKMKPSSIWIYIFWKGILATFVQTRKIFFWKCSILKI